MGDESENLTQDTMAKKGSASERAAERATEHKDKNGKVLSMAEYRANLAEIEAGREHPDSSVLTQQGDAAAEVFRKHKDLLEADTDTQATATNPQETAETDPASEEEVIQKLKEDGVFLEPEDYQTVTENIHLLVEHPELGPYLEKLSARLKELIQKCADLKEQNNERQAIYDSVDFFSKEMDEINATITNPEVRDLLLAKIQETIDPKKLEAAATEQAKLDLISEGADLIPYGVGDVKGITEAAAGRTMSGEPLTGLKRIGKFAWNTGSLALTFCTGGLSSLLTKTGEAAKTGLTAAKTVQAAATLHDIVEKIGKIENVGKLTATIGKISGIVTKYPQIVTALKVTKTTAKVAYHGSRSLSHIHHARKVGSSTDEPEADEETPPSAAA